MGATLRLTLLTLVLLVGCAENSLQSDVASSGPSADASAPLDAGSSGCGYEYLSVDATYDGAGEDGLNAQDALDASVGQHVELLQWGGLDAQTNLTIDLATPQTIRLVRSEETGCPTSLALETTMILTTDDGSLNETIPVTLSYSGGVVSLQTWIALDQLVGVWQLSDAQYARWDSVDVEIVADFEPFHSVGEIALFAESSNGESQSWNMAYWPAE